MKEADFVIVGSGSAGSALAARLSEDGRYSVIVIEYGGTDFGPFIQMPAALSFPMNMSRYDWGFSSEPEPHLGGRSLATPRGKVLGGSSSINGMVYVRGHARDFDHWAEEGATGWAFADVLPYFRRMETAHGGEAGWRGADGPLHVRPGRQWNPLYKAFVEAGALDLLLICVESGMSIEQAFRKVSVEVGSQSIPLAEELTLTTAELSYLQDRKTAYDNLAKRTDIDGVKSVCMALQQSERYGTPMAQTLRVMSQENRDLRMTEAEKKAAALPPKLTVPMILFFLPVLFIVILGPAGIRVSNMQ